MQKHFYYYSGEEVREGDRIRLDGMVPEHGKVVSVFQPGTAEGVKWSLPQGGVVIELDDGTLYSHDYIWDEEDIEFISRRDKVK